MQKVSIKRSAIGTASGAIDLFGGIAKACGGIALQTLPEPKTTVLATEVDAATVRVTSTTRGRFDCDSSPFQAAHHQKMNVDQFIEWMDKLDTPTWTRQALGCLFLFAARFAWSPSGITLSIASDLPMNIGLGSGISLKVATLKALTKLSGCYVGPQDLADLVQKVDTEILGRPSSPDRAITSVFGRPGHALAIDTRTGALQSTVELPKGVTLFTWNRPCDDTEQRDRFRNAAFGAAMGAALLAKSMPELGSDPLPSPATYTRHRGIDLPETLTAEQFRGSYGDSPLALPPGGLSVPVKSALEFSIRENHRAIEALHLLTSMTHRHKRKSVELIGELLFQSHHELSQIGLGLPSADQMIDALLQAGPAQGIFGARLSGEGHGCSVVVLADRKAIAAIRQVARQLSGDAEEGPIIV